jgi:hypothetical protein
MAAPTRSVFTPAFSCVRSVRITVVYALTLVTVALTLKALGPHAQDGAANLMSTNLHNLARGRLDTLVDSAFIIDLGDIYMWLPGVLCLLGLGELAWRGARLVAAFALGHIGATLIVAVWLVVSIDKGWLPHSLAQASDVGISYGVAGVLGSLTALMPDRWRAMWVGWWFGIAVWEASSLDFSAVGHLLALMLGVAVSARWRSDTRWTPARAILLAVGVVFSYLTLAGSWVSAALLVGLAGVCVAIAYRHGFRRSRTRTRSIVAASDVVVVRQSELSSPGWGLVTPPNIA